MWDWIANEHVRGLATLITALVVTLGFPAALWKLSGVFVLKKDFADAVQALKDKLDQEIKRVREEVEKDLRYAVDSIQRDMKTDTDRVLSKLEELGDDNTRIQTLSVTAQDIAAQSKHDGELLKQRVQWLDEHGTSAVRRLLDETSKLREAIGVLNVELRSRGRGDQ